MSTSAKRISVLRVRPRISVLAEIASTNRLLCDLDNGVIPARDLHKRAAGNVSSACVQQARVTSGAHRHHWPRAKKAETHRINTFVRAQDGSPVVQLPEPSMVNILAAEFAEVQKRTPASGGWYEYYQHALMMRCKHRRCWECGIRKRSICLVSSKGLVLMVFNKEVRKTRMHARYQTPNTKHHINSELFCEKAAQIPEKCVPICNRVWSGSLHHLELGNSFFTRFKRTRTKTNKRAVEACRTAKAPMSSLQIPYISALQTEPTRKSTHAQLFFSDLSMFIRQSATTCTNLAPIGNLGVCRLNRNKLSPNSPSELRPMRSNTLPNTSQ